MHHRHAEEQKEFQKEPVIDTAATEALLPRQSGSKEWRDSRGEMGKTGPAASGDVMSMMAGY